MLCVGILIMWCSAQQPAQAPVSTFCQIAEPIYFSASDTRKTKEAVDIHNRKWRAVCSKPKV